MQIPRYHPLITRGKWHICDAWNPDERGCPRPDVTEPCDDYDECAKLCRMLNEEAAKAK